MHTVFSDWLRIDLHIHTDWSRKTKTNDYKGAFSVVTLKEKIIENKVQIFSMTDHNIINIDAYKEYYKTYDCNTDPLLLVGVELDILVNNGVNDKTYHSLIIFDYSSPERAEDIYNRLENKYKEKGVADTDRTLTIGEVVSLFSEDDFFFIPHAGNTKSIVDAHKHNIRECQQMVLLMQSAFEKVPEKAIHKYNEGFDKTMYEAFQNKNDNAYIEFSDNHCVTNYPCTNKGDDGSIHQFYYVKGGKNFETLRLAFIDPQSRIKSESELIHLQRLQNYVEKIKISNNDLLQETELFLSPHLNVLIGGRSSGKSLMMSILGEKIDSVVIDNKKYSKVKYGDTYIKSKLDADYMPATAFSKDEIIFIKQGDIVRYFEDNLLEDLAKESNKHEQYQSSKEEFKIHKSKLDNLINGLISNYQSVRDIDIVQKMVLHNATLERMLNSNYIFKVDFNSLRSDNNLTDQLNNADILIENLTANIDGFSKDEMFELTESELTVVQQFRLLLDSKKELIVKKKDKNYKKQNFFDVVEILIQNRNLQLNSEAQNKVDANQSHQKLITNIGLKFKKLFDLSKACKEFCDFDYALSKSIEINEAIKLVLEVDKTDDLSSLAIDSINSGDFNNSLYLNILDLLRGAKNIKNYSDNKPETLKKKLSKQLEEILGKYSNPRDYLDYDNGNTSRNNSPGYNSEKYLEIILKNPNTKLILIDQPEDNLGNRFIAENLVKLLREIKFEKQVILVTHNPSIVVYGDAESVIIAENNENKISYKQVVIENETSQKEICKILDGGEYIFNMRSKKYNIKKILKSN